VQIRAFLAGQALGPETIREMSLALESIRETLGMRLIDDPATRLVAQKIAGCRGLTDMRPLEVRLRLASRNGVANLASRSRAL
jgi:hypothetical protein